MRIENFALKYAGGVELHAFGHNWDLHNCVDFRGLRYEPLSGEVILEWVPSPEHPKNPWGDPSNRAAICRLRFSNVRLLRLGPRDESFPTTEATCVETIEVADTNGQQRLVFTMQDARTIEVGAERVLLEREFDVSRPEGGERAA